MKAAFAVVAALLAGLVLGSWSLRGDLRTARGEVEALRRELARSGRRGQGLDGIASMLKIPDAAPVGKRTPPAHSPPTTHAATPVAAVGSQARTTNRSESVDMRRRGGREAGGFRERMETAASVWKTRSDLARAAFVSTVAVEDESAARFDVIMAAMNLRISNSVRTWVDRAQNEVSVSPETGLRVFNDLSGALVLTYDELDRAMPAGWRERAGPEFKVMDFINPDVVMPLAGIEDRFRERQDAEESDRHFDRRAP